MLSNPILDRIRRPGPKKILACDGGGIRGLISLEILLRLERELREALDRPELRLGDYFDFICGTSTGSIIAACLSAGMSVDQVRGFYLDHGSSMFDRAKWYQALREKYDAEPLAQLLKQVLNTQLNGGDYVYRDQDPPVLLGDPRLRGLLMLVMRNHETDSPWPVSNNPLAKYNQPHRHDCNLHLPLWQLVRASTAAPTFFPPEVVTLAPGTPAEHRFVFVDGGITTYNNPAYLAFQMATASPYQIQWQTGVDRLLIVSVGTGHAPLSRPNLQPDDLWLLDHAKTIPAALMNAASAGWDMVCRVLGECRFGGPIDQEFGDMVVAAGDDAAANWTGAKQFAYVRYDPDTSREGLDDLGLADLDAETIQAMDAVASSAEFCRIGAAYAERHVRREHLRGHLAAAV